MITSEFSTFISATYLKHLYNFQLKVKYSKTYLKKYYEIHIFALKDIILCNYLVYLMNYQLLY